MYVEFDLASLPTTVDLCRYPPAFTNGAGNNDSQWDAAFNLSGADPGDGSGGYETLVVAYTTPQAQNCSSNSAPLSSSVSAVLAQWDSGQQNYLPIDDLPVSVDVAHGKIIVQADRSASQFSGLSANSRIGMVANAIYVAAATTQTAVDPSPLFGFGGSFTDPLQDVQGCSAPCSTASTWYPQIDLVGGSVRMGDKIFANGFDP